MKNYVWFFNEAVADYYTYRPMAVWGTEEEGEFHENYQGQSVEEVIMLREAKEKLEKEKEE